MVDWSGGTRIGASLKAYNDEWGRRALTRGAVVVVLSDGFERGDPELLGGEMVRLARQAFAVVWVNPLKGHAAYEPLGGGMRAALRRSTGSSRATTSRASRRSARSSAGSTAGSAPDRSGPPVRVTVARALIRVTVEHERGDADASHRALREVHELVDASAEVEQVATGFTFTEGPIWMPDGSLHFSDMPGDKRRRWHPDEGVDGAARPEQQVQRHDARQRRQPDRLRARHELRRAGAARRDARDASPPTGADRELNSPNDVIVARDGSILFTDPTYGRMPGFGLEREQELDFQGVYRIPPGGGDLQLLVDDFAQPNGLCFSPDESLLYVNDTDRAHIRVFDVGPDHALSNGRVFAEGIGTGDHRERRARRRDEARRARQRLRDRPEGRLDHLAPRASTSA